MYGEYLRERGGASFRGETDEVVRLMLVQGLAAVGLGVVAGVLGSLVANRALASFLFGVEPTDPATLAAVAADLVSVAALPCWIPARRATRVDPSEALRAD